MRLRKRPWPAARRAELRRRPSCCRRPGALLGFATSFFGLLSQNGLRRTARPQGPRRRRPYDGAGAPSAGYDCVKRHRSTAPSLAGGDPSALRRSKISLLPRRKPPAMSGMPAPSPARCTPSRTSRLLMSQPRTSGTSAPARALAACSTRCSAGSSATSTVRRSPFPLARAILSRRPSSPQSLRARSSRPHVRQRARRRCFRGGGRGVPPFSVRYCPDAGRGHVLAVADESGLVSMIDTRHGVAEQRADDGFPAHHNAPSTSRGWRASGGS